MSAFSVGQAVKVIESACGDPTPPQWVGKTGEVRHVIPTPDEPCAAFAYAVRMKPGLPVLFREDQLEAVP